MAKKSEPSELDPMAKEALETIIKLRENHSMNLGGIPLLSESINRILESFVTTLQERLARKDEELAEEFGITARELIRNDPLRQVSTEQKVSTCLKLYCGLVEPKPVKQGIGFFPTYGDGNAKVGTKAMSAVYIPMEKHIEMLMQYREIRELCLRDIPEHDDTCIRSVFDGEIFKNHPVCCQYPKNCLLLQLYMDDVELCNPLGSHTKTNKVTMAYYSILNIPEELRASLKSINLVGVATAESIKEFGYEALLEDFFNFVKKLETSEGVSITIKESGETVVLHGTLLCISGDGLALNSFGGFKGIGFAHKPCRNCNLTKDDMGKVFYETKLRNMEEHTEMIKKLEDHNLTQQDRKELSKSFGVNGESVLAQLSNFDLTKCLCQDSMHNILEGVAEVELRALVREFVDRYKIINYQELNYLISGFPYPDHFKNAKPSPIDPAHILNGKLRQNASQMMCLLFTVPIMLNEIANEDVLCHLENFSLLAKISNIIFSFEVSKDSLDLCRFMVECHHTRFVYLYPDVKPTPKFHFLIHTPSVIENFGPIRNSWTMRFEGMNAWASKIGEQTRNFKNIPKTIATRFMTKKCLEFNFGDTNSTVLGNKVFHPLGEQFVDMRKYMLGDMVAAQFKLPIQNCGHVLAPFKIYLNNFEIETDSVLMIENDEESLPKFAMVKAIFVIDQNCVFVLKEFVTERFNPISNTYEITETNQFSCKNSRCVEFLHPLPTVKLHGKLSLILLYHSRTEFFG